MAERPVGPKVLKVDVVGKQWWWQFQFPKQHLVPASTQLAYSGSKTKGMVTGKDGKFSFPLDRLDGVSPAQVFAIKADHYYRGFESVPTEEERRNGWRESVREKVVELGWLARKTTRLARYEPLTLAQLDL